MRAPWLLTVLAAACGGGNDSRDAGVDARPDGPASSCQALGAQGQVIRRTGNPRLRAGATFTDGLLDIAITHPDVRWDGSAYHLYYGATHASGFGAADGTAVIRHASSPDRMAWTVDDAPVFAASAEPDAWDRLRVDAPTVIVNPAAPADRRYLMLYTGSAAAFPFPGYAVDATAIGAAFSADGVTFTRVPAAASPHAQAGLVLTGAQVYPGATGALVADPELALVDGVYHVWFSSFACTGPDCATVRDRGVAHATSLDGVAWTVEAAPVRSLLRASADTTTGGAQPSVIYDTVHCRYELWLTADVGTEDDAQPVELDNTMGVYRAESTDGVVWNVNYTRARDLLWTGTHPGEHLGLARGTDVAQNTTGRLMVYVGYDDQDVPEGAVLPDRTPTGFRPGVMTVNVATRDLP